jgi:hypothetical protein
MMAGKRVLVLALLALAGTGFGAWLSLDGRGAQAPEVRITSQGSNATVIDITVHGVEAEAKDVAGQAYTVVRLPGEPALTGKVGSPGLPQVVRNLGLPDNAQVSIEVLESEFQTFAGMLVYPAQKPLTDHDPESFAIDNAAYSQDAAYPAALTQLAYQTVWRGLPFANVVLSPMTYNPARRELRVYSHLRVRVSHPGIKVRRQVEPWMAAVYQNNIDNFDQLGVDVRWLDGPGVRYLVIAHSNYAGTLLDSLVYWHQKRGIETRVITKSSWTDAEVKDSIAAEYNRNTPKTLRWALLVGDQTQIPQHPYSGVGAADIWYGDIEPPGSLDDYFDVGISRFCPSSTGDLDNQIRKTLKFEKDPPTSPDWLSKVTLAAHSELYPNKYSACTRGIYNYPYAYYQYTFDTVMGGTNGTNTMVTADINEGRVVVNYRGHGSETAWTGWASGGGSWSASEIDALANGDMTPVVINCCCLNHVLTAGTCLGESWMSKYPGGAVASLGASEASYTIPNHGWDSLLIRCLGDTGRVAIPGVRDYVMPVWDLGWMQNNADAYIVKYYSSQGGIDNAHMYFWLGDPALTVWTGTPEAADVSYLPVIPLGGFDFEVSVSSNGSPIKDALVCAWKPGEFYVTGHTDASGNVTLRTEAATPGDFMVTVTAQTILPFEGTCMARTNGIPYVLWLRSLVNDSPPNGNGDGSINPGETIVLPTWVKNVGDSAAQGLTGTLRTSDAFITMLDSSRSYGNVPPHDSAYTGADGYRFSVAPACTNGHRIRFTLSCKDAHDSTWSSNLYLGVGVPELVYEGWEVIDTIAGGNGNGRLDPEEPGQVIVTLGNTGFGNAQNVTGVLVSYDTRLVVDDSVADFGLIPAGGNGGNGADPFTVHTLAMPPETPLPCTVRLACGGQTWKFGFEVKGEMNEFDPVPDGPRTPAAAWAYDDVDAIYDQRPEFNWFEISTRGMALYLGDDSSDFLQLPFSWQLYGQTDDYITICSNGWVAPGNQSSSVNANNTALPGAPVAGMVCVNWDDLNPEAGGRIYVYHDALRHRYIVEWDSVAYAATPTVADKFQVIIYDQTVQTPTGDNEIVMQYLTANGYTSSTIGLQNMAGDIGINCLFNNTYHRSAAPMAAERAIRITSVTPTAIAEPVTSTELAQRPIEVFPNPFNTSARVNWQMRRAGSAELKVYDAGGRVVRTLASGPCSAGSYTTVWDGADDAGLRLARGIYFVRLATPDLTVKVKTVLAR